MFIVRGGRAMKYVIMKKRASDILVPIVFDDMFTHKMIARGAMHNWEGRIIARPYSAGFIKMSKAVGESESLKLKSQEGDTDIIKEYYKL